MGDISIGHAFDLYCMDEITMRHRSAKTEESYRVCQRHLQNFFGDVNMQTINYEDIRKWRNHISTWMGPDTVRGNLICIRRVLWYLRKKKYQVLDYDEIPVPKRMKRVIKYLNEDEFWQFVAVLNTPRRGYKNESKLRNIAIAHLIFFTGLRNGEVCALNRNSFKKGKATIIGKSRDPRLVFINQSTQAAVDAYLNARKDNDKALFTSPQTGERVTEGTLQRVFMAACNRSAFEGIHPHTLRHSHATYMLEKQVDIRYIGDLMGHVDLNTTRLYTHYTNPKLENIYREACD